MATEADVAAWNQTYGLTIPVVLDAGGQFRDWVWQDRENRYLPTMVLLNEDLSIRHVDSPDDAADLWSLAVFADAF